MPSLDLVALCLGYAALAAAAIAGAAAILALAVNLLTGVLMRCWGLASNVALVRKWARNGKPQWVLCEDRVWRMAPSVGPFAHKED